jgi:predicted membrane channel-forming protein YqfA (hemolysin III family)
MALALTEISILIAATSTTTQIWSLVDYHVFGAARTIATRILVTRFVTILAAQENRSCSVSHFHVAICSRVLLAIEAIAIRATIELVQCIGWNIVHHQAGIDLSVNLQLFT